MVGKWKQNRSPIVEGFEYQLVGSDPRQEVILEAMGGGVGWDRKNS